MEVKPTARDQKVLDYLKENYSCKICNNILIQCITLTCGHNYCGYCLDMLGGMTRQCPQCLFGIKRSSIKPNSLIDQEIDELINSCSVPIQKAYAAALDSRFQKSLNRNKNRKEQHQMNDRYNDESVIPRSLDEICNAIFVNNTEMNQEHSVAKALKSARKSSNPYRSNPCPSSCQTPRRAAAAAQMKDATNTQKITKNSSSSGQSPTGIDVNKVDMLFGIYDHVLNIDNEPNKDMAGGDFVREQPQQNINVDINPTGMKNFAMRNEVQLASLIKETEDIIRLDDHIQKWTSKMNDALTGKADTEKESIGIADEKFDENVHKVDDELWRASSELLKKLRGMQQQRKTAVAISPASLGIPLIPPPPRSVKLDLEVVSDDSDVEEYEIALENLQESLKGGQQTSEVGTSNKPSTNNEIEKSHNRNNKARSKSSKRKSTGDSIEESGNCYVKENIEFITQMRKYKAALMKIQNHEVETAAEIKELLPTESFPSDENRYGQDYMVKCGGATTPRRLSHMSPIKPISHHNHKHSFSAKLPSQMPRRPMTASYDMPSISKQIMTPSPTKQYVKRGRASNPLYTAR